jgi:hypothetical protein
MLEHILDGLHVSITRRRFLQLFTAFVRVLLAVGFIPPSLKKIMGQPFTSLPDSNPVGAYFSALYNTGFYYEFIGWSQMIAAVLLLIPRTAHIGALMFLPIIVNIAVLTSSVGFKGTWVITILMSLAAAWLTVWEYDRLKPIVYFTRSERPRKFPYQLALMPIGFAIGGAAIGAAWHLIGLGNFPNYLFISSILMLGGAIFGVLVAVHYQFMPVGKLKESAETM